MLWGPIHTEEVPTHAVCVDSSEVPYPKFQTELDLIKVLTRIMKIRGRK